MLSGPESDSVTASLSERILGDYRLKNMLGEHESIRSWLAEQISINRDVLLEELREEAEGKLDAFLAAVRAKASVDHPLVASVYEAVCVQRPYFFTRELPAGRNFAERIAAGETFTPAVLAKLLRKVSEAYLYLESKKIATAPLDASHISYDDHSIIRLDNIAVGGVRDAKRTSEDIVALGGVLSALIAPGHSGGTRIATLATWMTGQSEHRVQTWQQIHEYAEQIETQLVEAHVRQSPQAAQGPVTKRGSRIPNLVPAVALGLVLVGAVAWFATRKPEPQGPVAAAPGFVHLPAGQYPMWTGSREQTSELWISSREVTIGEFAAFLDMLAQLSPDQRDAYDAKDQPSSKSDHLPADWDAMYAAAKSKGIWASRPMTLDCPIVNIDWWDAHAYAEWKRGRLPNQEEWFAAVGLGDFDPTKLVPATWGPVGSAASDKSASGLYDMAGGVAEWTGNLAENPAVPMEGKKPVLVGGSFLRPQAGARAREWVADRNLRRPDLGFRLVWDRNPE